MPPELLAKGVLSKAADVYSFGVIMYELWTQTRAWAGADLESPATHRWKPATHSVVLRSDSRAANDTVPWCRQA